MKLRSVSTDGVRGLPDRTFDFIDSRAGRAASLVVIAGPSGSGKTALLAAIVAAKEEIAPWGVRRAWSDVARPGAGGAKIRTTWELGEEERARLGAAAATLEGESIFGPKVIPGQGHDARLVMLLERYDHDPGHGKIELFPAERSLAREAAGMTLLDPSMQKRVRLDADVRKYGALHRYLYELHLGLHERAGEPPGRERFAASFAKLCPGRRVLGLTRTADGMELLFDGGASGPLPIHRLPHAEQQAVLFAGAFEMLGLHGSIVLVDTPELHQGSAGAGPFVRAIASLAPTNQVIFATGSAEVARELEEAVIVTLPAP